MGRFADLTKLKYGANVAEQQQKARTTFLSLIDESAFHSYRIGDPHTAMVSLVLGVETWNGYDMALLDRIDAPISRIDPSRLMVSLFDLDECLSHDDVRERIPGIDDAVQSPVLGLWADGQLVRTMWGHEARDLIPLLIEAEQSLIRNAIPANEPVVN